MLSIFSMIIDFLSNISAQAVEAFLIFLQSLANII